MALLVREMALDEVGLIIDYFHGSSPEHLEMLGVDPTRLPPRDRSRARYEDDDARPRAERSSMLVVWELDGVAVGFSTCDRIAYGEHAFMHLHVVDPERRDPESAPRPCGSRPSSTSSSSRCSGCSASPMPSMSPRTGPCSGRAFGTSRRT